MINENKLIQDIHNYFIERIDKSGLEFIDNDLLTLNKDICTIVKNQPKVDNWIPCSERLPEKRDWCLALFKEPYTGFVGLPKIAEYLMGSYTAYTTKEGWIISNCTDREDVSSEYYKDLICVAWMPLPNAYNAKRGGKNE